MNASIGATLGQRLRATREAHGWSRDGLAVRTGLTVTTLLRIELGRSPIPHAATLERLASALDVTPQWLVCGHTDASSTLGHRLRAARHASGLTRRQLATASGHSAGAIQQLELGRRQAPHFGTILDLATALSLTPEWLICGDAGVPDTP